MLIPVQNIKNTLRPQKRKPKILIHVFEVVNMVAVLRGHSITPGDVTLEHHLEPAHRLGDGSRGAGAPEAVGTDHIQGATLAKVSKRTCEGDMVTRRSA
ncbi:hypothetical protein EVAR_16233_1 [Eumeta japonica]|uniref:Uncharacterized protein n=1 Tax=Eumeta variegata TaxID=151549 RepID=A0A4C1U5Q6_EUMVA|nr:hypothetical protein EVAR_16233_1 [Eumeta japonica]